MSVVVPAWIFRNKRANNEMRRLRELNAQLLAAAQAVAFDLGEPAYWKDVCPEHHQELLDAIAAAEDTP